jgi:uncharacterized SAM-binding protein YcdF (DUF218 family)
MIIAFCCFCYLAYKVLLLWPQRQQRNKRWWFGAATAFLALLGLVFGIITDVVAQKALALLILPAGLAWLLLLVIAGILWRLKHQGLALLTSATWLIYTLAGNVWVGTALIRGLEKSIPVVEITSLPPMQAVFVLGGGTSLSENGPAVGDSGDRLVLAASLFHAGKTPLLICTGRSIDALDFNRDLAQETATIWQGLGVPAAHIYTPSPGQTITSEEIAIIAQLIQEHEWTHVGLITSAWHMPRALRLCHTYDINPIPLGADRRGRMLGLTPYYFIPQRQGFENVQIALWEYLGMLAGR